jgi:uncharacterized membrane protein
MSEQNKNDNLATQQVIQDVNQNPNIPDQVKHQIIATITSFTAFSGPIPPPEMLAQYEKIFPGAAKQIFSMAESQSNHRMVIEKKAITSATIDSKMGIIAGLLVALALIGASLKIITTGHTLSGFAVIVGTLAAIVYSFRYEVNRGQKQLNEKERQLQRNYKK